MCQAGEDLHRTDEEAGHASRADAGQHDVGQLDEGCEFLLRDQECRLSPEHVVRHDRGHHGSDDHRDEAAQRVFHHHHLHGEDHAGERGVERTGDGRRRAAGDQHPEGIVRQMECLAHQAGTGRTQVHGGPLPAAGLTGDQCQDPAEELDHGVSNRQMALVPAQALDDVCYPYPAIGVVQAGQGERQQHRTCHGKPEALDVAQSLEGLGSLRQDGGRDCVHACAEKQNHQAGEQSHGHRQDRELRQGLHMGQALLKELRIDEGWQFQGRDPVWRIFSGEW